jgi:hypothetical protein
MARLALEVFFDEALRLVERFEPAGPAQHLASNFIAGIKSLPVRAVPRPGQEGALAAVAPLDGP